MSLIGYVSLEEANQYISTHYLTEDALRLSWEDLIAEDQIVLLTRSFQTIELLPFSGRKLKPEQSTVFPRWPYKEVPEAIKWAQIEIALAKSDASNEEDTQYYEKLWTYGVESYSIGNLSERVSTGSYGLRGAQATGIVSAVAERLLRPYLGGGYRM